MIHVHIYLYIYICIYIHIHIYIYIYTWGSSPDIGTHWCTLCRICGSQSPRAMSSPLLDMSQCAGASACRFCAVIGALAFDEPFSSWPAASAASPPLQQPPQPTPARRFSSQQVGPPLFQQPAPVPAPAAAASASADGNDGQEALAKRNGAGESFIGPLQQAWHPVSPAVFVPAGVIPHPQNRQTQRPCVSRCPPQSYQPSAIGRFCSMLPAQASRRRWAIHREARDRFPVLE